MAFFRISNHWKEAVSWYSTFLPGSSKKGVCVGGNIKWDPEQKMNSSKRKFLHVQIRCNTQSIIFFQKLLTCSEKQYTNSLFHESGLEGSIVWQEKKLCVCGNVVIRSKYKTRTIFSITDYWNNPISSIPHHKKKNQKTKPKPKKLFSLKYKHALLRCLLWLIISGFTAWLSGKPSDKTQMPLATHKTPGLGRMEEISKRSGGTAGRDSKKREK